MMIEPLEARSLFAVTLPAAVVVLPLTPANSNAEAPSVDIPSAATAAAGDHLADALAHHAQGK